MAKTSLNKRKLNKTESSGKDMFSNLPDHLLCRILFELSTKDSVRTSILSKRWRNLWLHVPALDLDFSCFQHDLVFMEFIDRFMKSNERLDIQRAELIYDVDEPFQDSFVWSIDDVVKHKVCHLTVLSMLDISGEEALVRMPLSLYSCATLVNLTLYCVVLDNPKSELVSLPCVKTIHLEAVKFDGISILETLISSCPVLKDLVVITHPDDYLKAICVRSQSLKSFKLESLCFEYEDPDVEIDTPRLEYMSICDHESESFIIHSIGPSATVNIDVVFDVEYDNPLKIAMIRNFIIGISIVHEMTISTQTLEVIHSYSKLEPLPQFSNMSRLDVLLVESSWELLPTFLGSCINLQSLILKLDSIPEKEEIKVSHVPQCFLSSLEFVELKIPITVKETSNMMKLEKYFRKNCVVLKKLVLSLF